MTLVELRDRVAQKGTPTSIDGHTRNDAPLFMQDPKLLNYRFFLPAVKKHIDACVRDQDHWRGNPSVPEDEAAAHVASWEKSRDDLLAKEQGIEAGGTGGYNPDPPRPIGTPPGESTGAPPPDSGLPPNGAALLTLIGSGGIQRDGMPREQVIEAAVDTLATNPEATSAGLAVLIKSAGADDHTSKELSRILARYIAQNPNATKHLVDAADGLARGEPGAAEQLAEALGRTARDDPAGTAQFLDAVTRALGAPGPVRRLSGTLAEAAENDPEATGNFLDAIGGVHRGDEQAGEELARTGLELHRSQPQLAHAVLASVIGPTIGADTLPPGSLRGLLDALAADPEGTVSVGKALAGLARGDEGALADLGQELATRVPGFRPGMGFRLREARDRLATRATLLAELEAATDELLEIPIASRGEDDSWSTRRASLTARVKTLQASVAALRKVLDAAP